MNITAIRSDRIYREMMNAAPAEKENIYRDELMKPFAFKWSCVGIPLRAETFAANMFGEDKVGKWVRETTPETLRETVKPLIRANLMTRDFQALSSYLYGDEIMALRGGQPIGMPYCGGYACGYALIRHFLKKTGASIYEATITPTVEILKQTEDFWQ